MKTKIIGYKAMNADMTCRNYKFKVGETYKTDKVSICSEGFHFCKSLLDVYNYYPKATHTAICEVEALGEVQEEGDKSVTNEIKIIRQLETTEILDAVLKRGNSGNRNSGDWNSGDGNSGNRNSGDGNSGNRNSGDGNSGYWNSGNRNSGYGNSGNRNSGDWNSGDGNSGYFNTSIPVYFFNKPSILPYTKELENKMRNLSIKPILQWVPSSLMTEEEKTSNPSYKTTEGFLRNTERYDFRSLTEENKTFIRSLPNYDDEIFQKISNGVSLLEDIEVTVNGVTKKISYKDAKNLGLV